MEKIPTIFERDWEGDRSLVLNKPVPGCEWVFAGEGLATRKYDGTCVRVDEEHKWWARREVKAGKEEPEGFVPISHDHITLAAMGWQPIEYSPFAKFHAEALEALGSPQWITTYELCGPKINKNLEGFEGHVLIPHVPCPEHYEVDRTFESLPPIIADLDIEGFVFQHPDGRMAKIKGRDFGIKRGQK